MNKDILDINARVVFFPVRHHSPACAHLVKKLADRMKPAAILIEGPSDYNLHLSELTLEHSLPIAIYSYARLPDGTRRGAFYPFCDYSPEWQALLHAKKSGSIASFIDLPWAEIASPATQAHRYSDRELVANTYLNQLCEKFGAEDFNSLWDTLVESDHELSLEKYLGLCHLLMYHARLLEGNDHETLMREEFMAREIKRALEAVPGKILVVTGAWHSYALFLRVLGLEDEAGSFVTLTKHVNRLAPVDDESRRDAGAPDEDDECRRDAGAPDEDDECQPDSGAPDDADDDVPFVHPEATPPTNEPSLFDHSEQDGLPGTVVRGIALTPYSYERLDSLKGYEAGMPGPGFYHQAYEDRANGKQETYRNLLFQAITSLRKKGKIISAADLIAVESSARALAALRGHKLVWRTDLIDAIMTAVVKEDLLFGSAHPLLEAVEEVFRGERVGKLALDAQLPPLVKNIEDVLKEYDLFPEKVERVHELDLMEERDLEKSYILHQLQMLQMTGFTLTESSVLEGGDEQGRLLEKWAIKWTVQFAPDCIERALYGTTLADAAAVRLMEKASGIDNNSESAALLLMEACLMGFNTISSMLYGRVRELINHDGNFFSVTGALFYILHLYRYDQALSRKPLDTIGTILYQVFDRSVWLLETLGEAGNPGDLVDSLRLILETYERCGQILEIDRQYFLNVLHRARNDNSNSTLMRGAITGMLWTLGEALLDEILADLQFFCEPNRLGDFLTGLFALAREAVQHRKELIIKIDEFLMSFDVDQFLEALPSLRLAFSYFTPREKHYLAQNLVKALGLSDTPLPALQVSATSAALVMAYEERIKQTLEKFMLRGRPQ